MKKDIASIEILPDELLVHIFSYLTVSSLSKVSMTHQRWHMLIADDKLWQALLLRDFPQFYPDKQALDTLQQSAYQVFIKEYQMKIIVSRFILDREIPNHLKNKLPLWEILFERFFPNITISSLSTHHDTFLNHFNQAGSAIQILRLLAKSGYAKILDELAIIIQNREDELATSTLLTLIELKEDLQSFITEGTFLFKSSKGI